MRVLVTGSEGLIGSALCELLVSRGHSYVGFDITSSDDILEPQAIKEAGDACDAIVHCAALLGQPGQKSKDIFEANLQGTWNVIQSAAENDIHKVVFLSSVDVLGVFKGQKTPDFLPLDESHRCYPSTPYGISKHLAENACNRVSTATGLSVVCLRPPGVWQPETYHWIIANRRKRAEFEWDPFWEYGAFIDLRDMAEACLSAIAPSVIGFHTLFVSSDDITTSGETSAALSHRLHPDTEWRGGIAYSNDPYRTLLCNDAAKDILDWKPLYRWSDFVSEFDHPAVPA